MVFLHSKPLLLPADGAGWVTWLEAVPYMGLTHGQVWADGLLCEISTRVSGIVWVPRWELVPTPGYI